MLARFCKPCLSFRCFQTTYMLCLFLTMRVPMPRNQANFQYAIQFCIIPARLAGRLQIGIYWNENLKLQISGCFNLSANSAKFLL